jgi:hypothetical protein
VLDKWVSHKAERWERRRCGMDGGRMHGPTIERNDGWGVEGSTTRLV